GIALTLRRLRSASLPSWLICFFFMPFINLLFFLILAIVPSKDEYPQASGPDRRPKFLDRVIPKDAIGSTAVAVALTLPVALGATWLGTSIFKQYGWGLFVGIPFCQGLMAALLHSYHQPRSYGSCLLVACFASTLSGMAIMALAIEGLICLA